MRLQRINAGHYVVTEAEREVSITKDLGRAWNIKPPVGADLPAMKSESYAEAKTIAVEMLSPSKAEVIKIAVKPSLVDQYEKLQLIACEMIDAVEVLKRRSDR